jgi:antitoxin VapB
VRTLQERLERTATVRRGLDLVSEMEAIARRVRALPELDARTDEEILGYNEHGLLGRHGN